MKKSLQEVKEVEEEVKKRRLTFSCGSSCMNHSFWDALPVVDLKALNQPEVLEEDGATCSHSLCSPCVVNRSTCVGGQKGSLFLACKEKRKFSLIN